PKVKPEDIKVVDALVLPNTTILAAFKKAVLESENTTILYAIKLEVGYPAIRSIKISEGLDTYTGSLISGLNNFIDDFFKSYTPEEALPASLIYQEFAQEIIAISFPKEVQAELDALAKIAV
ncbi:MAG: hypothetical protein V4581_16645, partial [Bacteroidota bacterium]